MASLAAMVWLCVNTQQCAVMKHLFQAQQHNSQKPGYFTSQNRTLLAQDQYTLGSTLNLELLATRQIGPGYLVLHC
jgi:hypothetical protein